MKVKIEISKFDIKKGKIGQVSSCPIALAIKRKLKATDLYVGDCANFRYKGTEYWADLPDKAHNFINRFDHNLKVKPFSFILTAGGETEG